MALSFVAVALWTLIPDRIDEDDAARASGHGVLLATVVSFFLAEIGDKTQIATAVIAAEYHPLWQVIAGTTSGMLLADVPAVWLPARASRKGCRCELHESRARHCFSPVWHCGFC